MHYLTPSVLPQRLAFQSAFQQLTVRHGQYHNGFTEDKALLSQPLCLVSQTMSLLSKTMLALCLNKVLFLCNNKEKHQPIVYGCSPFCSSLSHK